MAVQIPAMVIVGALKAVQSQANARAGKVQAEAQTRTDLIALKRFQMEVAAQDARHRRSLEAQDRTQTRQLEAFNRLADLSQQNAQRKIEAYLEVFRDVRDVLRDQQSAYQSELQQVTQASFSASSEGHVLINKRKTEIDRELGAIRAAIMENAKAAYSMIAAVFPDIPQEHRIAIENLSDD